MKRDTSLAAQQLSHSPLSHCRYRHARFFPESSHDGLKNHKSHREALTAALFETHETICVEAFLSLAF
jgi:hypothetical protein